LTNRDAAFSMSFIVNLISTGIGSSMPILFPWVAAFTGASAIAVHRDALIFFAAFAALSPVSLAVLLKDFEETPRPRARVLTRTPRMGLLLRFSILNGLIGLGAGFIIPLIPTWLLLRFGISEEFSGPLLGVSNLTIGFAALLSTRLAKRYGPVRAIVLTEALSTIFMVSLAFVPDPVTAGGLYIVRAALMMMSSPISDSYIMSIIDPETRGIASAINSIVWRLPNSASTVVGGFLLGSGQFQLPFFIAAGFYLTSISGFYVLFRGVRPAAEPVRPARG
jgi:predicted MFS family arabinose efflux permease